MACKKCVLTKIGKIFELSECGADEFITECHAMFEDNSLDSFDLDEAAKIMNFACTDCDTSGQLLELINDHGKAEYYAGRYPTRENLQSSVEIFAQILRVVRPSDAWEDKYILENIGGNQSA